MAAYPFQPFPTFAEYCEWLIGQGGKVAEGGKNEWGSFTRLSSPNNRLHALEAGTKPDERLVPSTIERLDSRLGIVSPWNSSHTI